MASDLMSDLPGEILTEIFDSLEGEDALSFRSTNRLINAKTFFSFRDTFFHNRVYNFCRKDLLSLAAVAADERFAPSVEHLEINLIRWDHADLHAKIEKITSEANGARGNDSLGEAPPASTGTEQKDKQAIETARQINAFDEQLAGRLQLLESREIDAILETALTRFTNLRSIATCESYQYHCWKEAICDSSWTPRFGTLPNWYLLGDHVGGLHRLQQYERFHLFTQLLRSLSRSAPLQFLTTLDMHVSSFEFGREPIALPEYLAAQLTTCGLKFVNEGDCDARKVYLQPMEVVCRESRYGLVEDDTDHVVDGDHDWLVQWLNRCHKLKELTICLTDYEMTKRIGALASTVYLPSLEDFCLYDGPMDIRDDVFYNGLTTLLVRHSKRLKYLHLADIKLGWCWDSARPHTCGDFIKLLASFKNLQQVTFKDWMERVVNPNDPSTSSWFKLWPEREEKGVVRIEGTAEEVQLALNELSWSYRSEAIIDEEADSYNF